MTAKREALQAWIDSTKGAPGKARAAVPTASGQLITQTVAINDTVAGTLQRLESSFATLLTAAGCDTKSDES